MDFISNFLLWNTAGRANYFQQIVGTPIGIGFKNLLIVDYLKGNITILVSVMVNAVIQRKLTKFCQIPFQILL